MSREEAEAGAGAHAITKWIGARATDLEPRVLSIRPRMPGWVMVCSDGLWNHVPDPTDLAGVVGHYAAAAAPGADGRPDPDAVAAALTEFANAQGGFDNVTVALWRADDVPVRPEASPSSPDAPVE
jgi:serine/threonine protein phosphatase PrpC